MDIEGQFNMIADEYDGNRRRFIPCFDDFYGLATDFIAFNRPEPKQIIDLGAGTGLLTQFWYQKYPNAKYLLVDIADEMLKVARKRFFGAENIAYQTADYVDGLPKVDFDAAISALSVHHLENEEKVRLFSRIYGALPSGGLFVNYDQFCAGAAEMSDWFDQYWESRLAGSGLTDQDIALWRERRKLDRECSVEDEIGMLRDSGFEAVQCVYSSLKFSVIAAVKA